MTKLHDQLRQRAGLEPLAATQDGASVRPAARGGDAPHPSGEDRYAIYSAFPGAEHDHRRLAETSLEGIGLTLRTLRDEEEFTNDSRIGILDRETRQWLVNPWGAGR